MHKDFDNWIKLKKKIDNRSNLPTFQNREIWWCSIGDNVGHEENGKGNNFHRPILVVRKFNKRLFLGVPLTTKIKESYFYHKIILKEKQQCAMLSQIRVFDSARMNDKLGKLSKEEYNKLCLRIKELIP